MHFGAVDYESYIYINHKEVYHNIGGYVGFEVDITDYVIFGKENTIMVCAIDGHPNGKASGKQSENYYSIECCYTRTTGIWQTVWLEFVPKAYIKSVKYYPDYVNGILAISAVVEGDEILIDVEDGKLTVKKMQNDEC